MTTTAASVPADPLSGGGTLYTPPLIPSTFLTSLSAWVRSNPQRDAADAELHLYRRHTPYFAGATPGNAPNAPFDVAWQRVQAGAQTQGHSQEDEASEKEKEKAGVRGTMGTQLAPDGKVGAIRLVDIDEPSSASASNGAWLQPSSWLGKTTRRQLNMLEVGQPTASSSSSKEEEAVVLLHGYGAGTGLFFQNIKALAEYVPPPGNEGGYTRSRLYALDWLGMGRSARVPWTIRGVRARGNANGSTASNDDALSPTSSTTTTTTDSLLPSTLSPGSFALAQRVRHAEDFFLDSLETWRLKVGIERMTLCAHSLGGYLALAYAMKHPQRVGRIVLISPAGIGRNTHDPDGMASVKMQRDENGPISAPLSSPFSPANSGSSTKKENDPNDAPNRPPRMGKRTRAVFSYLWDANISIFSLIRSSLFFGPLMTGRYTRRRFGALEAEEDLRTLHAYTHAIFTSKGSGEYALAHLLAPGAYARWAMVDRIVDFSGSKEKDGGSASASSTNAGAGLSANINVPVSFIYGKWDWMDVSAGRQACQLLREAGNTRCNTFVVQEAGHHVYLDNPVDHDRLLRRILEGRADGDARGAAAQL